MFDVGLLELAVIALVAVSCWGPTACPSSPARPPS